MLTLSAWIQVSASSDVNATLEGIPCLALALSLASFPSVRQRAESVVHTLLAGNASPATLDPVGCSPVHRAASLGVFSILDALRRADAPMAGKDYALNTPLHFAACSTGPDALQCVESLVEDAAADESLENLSGATPYLLAIEMGNAEAASIIGKKLPALEKTASASVQKPTAKPTLVLHSDECMKHAPGEAWGPESNRRMAALVGAPFGALRSSEFEERVTLRHVTQTAAITDVLRVHEYTYIATLKEQCEELGRKEQAEEEAAQTSKKKEMPNKRLDLDTVITSHSYTAAMVTAQAVVEAVDSVLDGDAPNAFCVTRPAGHHAGPRGAATCRLGGESNAESLSHGFCLLSNVAIGAAHAMAVRGADRDIKRVAIVDFDVHHGNGTEEVVRNLVPSKHKFESSTPFGSFSLSSWNYKPWLTEKDHENVFFGSIHACGTVTEDMGAKYADGTPCAGPFYPGTGQNKSQVSVEDNILNIALGPKFGTAEFREAVESTLLPSLDRFKPDLIMVSAGFDASVHDRMNYGLVTLCDDDYFWVTDRLRSVAEKWSAGRLVSVLEGGYNVVGDALSPLARCVASHVRALCKPAPAPYTENPDVVSTLQARLLQVEAVKQAQAEGTTRSGRRKRKRAAVDYAALDK